MSQVFYSTEEYDFQVAELMEAGLSHSRASEEVARRELADAFEYEQWRKSEFTYDERDEWFLTEDIEFSDVPF